MRILWLLQSQQLLVPLQRCCKLRWYFRGGDGRCFVYGCEAHQVLAVCTATVWRTNDARRLEVYNSIPREPQQHASLAEAPEDKVEVSMDTRDTAPSLMPAPGNLVGKRTKHRYVCSVC